MEGKLFRVALIRPLGKFVPTDWNDFPRMGVVVQVGKPMRRNVAIGHAFSRNSMLRMAGETACVVLIRPGQTARVGDLAQMAVPVYEVA